MERNATAKPPILQAAARARIEDIAADREAEAQARAMWALGDYHTFATQTVWGLGPVLVQACGITAGQRVLDVAAGTGNVAIRAAEAGAAVVASDLTPENFEAGRREARVRGVELDWVEADAEALPFGDGEFDVVTSSVGAIFAADHQAVADELVRVCRPGGTIGMINFTPEAAEFFDLFGPYAPPPPPGALSPVLWGDEAHVRELFGDRLAPLELSRSSYVERSPGDAAAYCDFFKQTFGPVVGLRASLADRPDRLAAIDRDFLEFATRANSAPPGRPAEYRYEYLLVVGRRR
jgi:ubiquinone/menaquinone biosynthesis C-methylase UbiE